MQGHVIAGVKLAAERHLLGDGFHLSTQAVPPASLLFASSSMSDSRLMPPYRSLRQCKVLPSAWVAIDTLEKQLVNS